jgi:hypothetical protein
MKLHCTYNYQNIYTDTIKNILQNLKTYKKWMKIYFMTDIHYTVFNPTYFAIAIQNELR